MIHDRVLKTPQNKAIFKAVTTFNGTWTNWSAEGRLRLHDQHVRYHVQRNVDELKQKILADFKAGLLGVTTFNGTWTN